MPVKQGFAQNFEVDQVFAFEKSFAEIGVTEAI
jgi:hypothetical protein